MKIIYPRKHKAVKYNCNIVSFLILVLLSGLSIKTHAQNFHLVKDINTSTDANPQNYNSIIANNNTANVFAVLNGVSYFAADDGINGTGLWRSDGSSAGTYQVKDSVNPNSIIVSKGKLFFLGGGIRGLWTSDGTDAGTVPVFNAPPGFGSFEPTGLTDLNGIIYFGVAHHGTNDQLWKSDGTAIGTVLIRDFFSPVFLNAGFDLFQITAVKGKIYFSAASYTPNYTYVTRLWVSDGSLAGTFVISTNIEEPAQMIAGSSDTADHSVYFTAATVQNGTRSLYVTDGQPGIAAVATGFNGVIAPWNYYYEDIISSGGSIYVIGYNSSNLARSLYRYNISAHDVQPVKLVNPSNGPNPSNISDLTDINGTLFFTLFDATNNKYQLWKSDGTSSGNVLLKDSIYGGHFINGNGFVFFSANSTAAGSELWRSDGMVNGTMLIKDIYPGTNSSRPYSLTFVNNKLLFSAQDDTHGKELWQSDGTSNGTLLLKDINQAATSGSYLRGLTALNNKLFFSANDGKGNYNPFKTDGTNIGTSVISDTITGFVQYFFPINNQVGFWASTTAGKQGLFKTDAATGATVLIKAVPGNQLFLATSIVANNLTYFYLYNSPATGYQLWRTDGTYANTFIVRNDSTSISKIMAVGNTLFFVLSNSNDLWKTDGTVAGTVIVKTLPSSPNELVAHNDMLFITLNGLNYSLWKSDGSSTGTVKVTDKVTDATNFFSYPGALFFTAVGDIGIYGDIGRELYKTDGTDSGTVLVSNIHPYNAGTYTSLPINMNGVLYFFTSGTVGNKTELWKSDGTNTGTKLVSTVGNTGYQYPSQVTSCNGNLFFVVDNVLWQSDGIAAGTHAVTDNIFSDIVLNNYSSYPTTVGNKLFFIASNYQFGEELYQGDISPAILNYITAADGNWNNPATWIGNVVPPDGYNVIIRNNVLANINALCSSLTVEPTGKLTVNTGINIAVIQ